MSKPNINGSKKYHQGFFKPTNPSKYMGDVNNIIYRSSWEARLMSYFDKHSDIVEWASEPTPVPYKCMTDNKWHRYFPDFLIKTKNGKVIMIEVKPLKETAPPKQPKKGPNNKRYLTEVLTYSKNQSKWKAAEQMCSKLGWEFKILTEKEIFNKNNHK